VEIMDMIADFFATKGNARLIAWLVLSGRLGELPRPAASGEPGGEPPLRALIEKAHAQRQAAFPDADYDDTRFRSQLTAIALLGEAIFGDLVRYASGDATGAEQSREFRRRLAKLLTDTVAR
jgi:hypothetical protein